MSEEFVFETWKEFEPKSQDAVFSLCEVIEADGALSSKIKYLVLMALTASNQAWHSVKYNAAKAKEKGATKEEVFEVLQLLLESDGLPTFMGSLEALEDVVF